MTTKATEGDNGYQTANRIQRIEEVHRHLREAHEQASEYDPNEVATRWRNAVADALGTLLVAERERLAELATSHRPADPRGARGLGGRGRK